MCCYWQAQNKFVFLVMQDLLKQTDRAGEDTKDLQRAVEVMHVVPKAADDMMNVGRLQGFQVIMHNLIQFQANFKPNEMSLKLIE